jgi:hypothetical protein
MVYNLQIARYHSPAPNAHRLSKSHTHDEFEDGLKVSRDDIAYEILIGEAQQSQMPPGVPPLPEA